ncbi:unnamed protein product [Effrenium voratum]|uniref:Uncharacterized protein n=1 Tax=Effrenium voratum TaxID=2562239 RepID=A0AA36I291_9DINO|nr:unnamed protein product [Effrenium voratum]
MSGYVGELSRGGKPNPDEALACHFDQLQEAVISGTSEHAQKLLDMVCQRAAQPTDSAKRDALAAIMEGQGVVTWDAVRLESELEAHPSKKQKRVHKAPLQEELAQQGIEPPRRATVAQLQSMLKPKAKALKARQKPPAPFKSRGDVSSYLYIDRWMCEPIAVENIHAFGKLRAAGQLNLRPTLSEFLARDVRGTGHVWSVYRACGTARQMSFQGRMYPGFHQHLYDELLKKEVSEEQKSAMTPGGKGKSFSEIVGNYHLLPPVFEELRNAGMQSYAASRAAFTLPNLERSLIRSGLPLANIDQCNSSAQILLNCHPNSPCLRRLVEDREAVYRELGVPRVDAKKFMNAVLFGGGHFLVEDFRLTHRQCEVHILEKRKGYVEAQLQTFLCQREERRIVDEMDRALQQSRLGQVVSWDDGLVVAPFHTPADFDLAAWQKKVLEVMQSASPNPLALKPQESFAEVLATYKALYPDLDWTREDSDWLETEKVRRKLTGYLATGIDNADKLVVKLLSREILPCGATVSESFKCLATSRTHLETAYFDAETGAWRMEAQAHLEEQLSDMASEVILSATPPKWKGMPPAVAHRTAAMRVIAKSALQGKLYDAVFMRKLNGEAYRRFVMFRNGKVMDRDDYSVTTGRRELLISMRLNIDYNEGLFEQLDSELDDLVTSLQAVRDFEAGMTDYLEDSTLPVELQERLNAGVKHPAMGALETLRSCTDCWETALYHLKVGAYRLFAREWLEEAHCWVGEGGNGKTWQRAALFGTYSISPGHELLSCPAKGLESASPARMRLQGTRLVTFSEMERAAAVHSSIFKQWSEHCTRVQARNLFSDIVEFQGVQFGMILSTNKSISFTDLDGGVERRLSMPWPMRFTRKPTAEPNHRNADVSLKNKEVLAGRAPGLMWLLMKIARIFPGGNDTVVRPRPYRAAVATRAFFEQNDANIAMSTFLDKLETTPQASKDHLGYMEVLESWYARCKTFLAKARSKQLFLDTRPVASSW